MEQQKRLARIAGSLYLGVAVLGGFAELVVRDRVVELGHPGATADGIRDSATLFRVGFAADLAQATLFLFTAMALYLLLRGVNELVARAMVVIVTVSVAIICLNLLNQWVALWVATDEAFANAFGAAGSDALTGLFAGMHHDGYLIAQIFFGLWLLPLGYLVDTFATFLAPSVADAIEAIVVAPAAIGELAFVAYLLIKGVRVRDEESLPLASVAS